MQFDKEDSKVLIQLLEFATIVATISINQHYICQTEFILSVYEAIFFVMCCKFQSDRRVMRQSAKPFENQIAAPCVKSL